MLQKIDDLHKQLESVSASTNQVKKWTNQAAIATEQGEKNVTMAERTVERVQTNLKVCISFRVKTYMREWSQFAGYHHEA